jgi:hypothetical protein
MAIIVYNRNVEDHSSSPNNYPIFRGKSVLANPFTDKKLSKTLAIYQAKDRDDAIKKYSTYFDTMYGHNESFTSVVDEIYEKYKNGEDVYLECFCKPLPCHGDIIARKLEKRLLKEKITEIKNKRDAK